MQRHPVEGSERKPVAGAKLIGPASADERLEVSVLVRQSATAALQDRIERLNKGDTSLAPLTREAFAASHGAAKADIAAVESFAAQHHLTAAVRPGGPWCFPARLQIFRMRSVSAYKTMNMRKAAIVAAKALLRSRRS